MDLSEAKVNFIQSVLNEWTHLWWAFDIIFGIKYLNETFVELKSTQSCHFNHPPSRLHLQHRLSITVIYGMIHMDAYFLQTFCHYVGKYWLNRRLDEGFRLHDILFLLFMCMLLSCCCLHSIFIRMECLE